MSMQLPSAPFSFVLSARFYFVHASLGCVHWDAFPGCNLSLNEKIMFPFNILLSRLMRNIILVLVLCTSFEFDRHYARSRPLLLSLIFLACLLTFSFVALTVSHFDVRNHESDAKTGQYRTLCPNLR